MWLIKNSVIVPEVISQAYSGYFPLMASLPLGEAKAREDNFYRCGVGKRSI